MSLFKMEKFGLPSVAVVSASLAGVLTLLLVRGVVVNTKRRRGKASKIRKREEADDYIVADEGALERFSEAIRCETVSWSSEKSSPEELLKLHELVKRSFPTVHSSPLVTCEVVNTYSLLFSIKGSDPTLKPYLIISHLDVVPVTDQQWNVPPFAGLIQDGYIYGRGTLDVKNGVMGSLEALEYLLKSGYKPQRGFFLSFGHDEEVQGYNGAAHIAELLVSRGVSLEFIHDEGLVILSNVVPGCSKPVAGIGVAEKGRMEIQLSVESQVGHASMPPRETSIGILARAVARIESNPMPSVFGTGPEEKLFTSVACDVPMPLRIVLSNLWLFRPLVVWLLSKRPTINALVRSTIGFTRISGGTKENVVPACATATLDIRIHPSNTVDEVIRHLRSCIKDDRVQLKVKSKSLPSPVAQYDQDSFGYNAIVSSILDVFPDVVIAPALLVAGTDSKHFLKLTSNVYRFMPSRLDVQEVKMVHGVDERIGVKNYEQTINFYHRLMKNADQG